MPSIEPGALTALRGAGGVVGTVAGLVGKLASSWTGLSTGAKTAATGVVGAANTVANSLRPIEAQARSATERVVGFIHDTVTEFGALATRLSSTAVQFGTTTQVIQGLEVGTGAAGVGADALRGSLSTLQQRMYGVVTESEESIKAFNRLGVSVLKAGGGFKPVTEVFDEAIGKLIAIEDPTIRAGRALATVGEAGLQTANYWRDKGGIQAYRDFTESVRGFGTVLDQDVRAVGSFRSESFRLGLVLRDFKNDVGGPVHEVLGQIAGDLFQWVKAAGPAGSASKGVRAAVVDLGDSLRGPLTEGLKTAFTFGQQALPVVITGIKTVSTVGLELVAGLSQMSKGFGEAGAVGGAVALGLALAFAPTLTVFAGLLLLIEDFINYSKGIPSVTGDAIAAFRGWVDDITKPTGKDPFIIKAVKDFVRDLVGLPPKFQEAMRPVREFFDQLAAISKNVLLVIDKVTGATVGAQKRQDQASQLDERYEAEKSFNRAQGRAGGFSGTAEDFERNRAQRDAFVGLSLRGDLAPSPLGPILPPGGVPTVPVVPYNPGGGGKTVQVNAPVTVVVQGQVLDGKEFVKRIKPELEGVWEEQLLTTLRSAQP